jgi:hypothetical protein
MTFSLVATRTGIDEADALENWKAQTGVDVLQGGLIGTRPALSRGGTPKASI